MKMLSTVLLLGLALPGFSQNPTTNNSLKLYASFDRDAKPEIASDGAGLKKAEHLQTVEGKSGKAIYVSDAATQLTDLVYSTGNALTGPEWTIALWLKTDSGKTPIGAIFRTFSTGEWGKGDITAGFTKWKEFRLSRFDGHRKEKHCQIAADAVPTAEWTHLAWTSKNGHAAVYINGYEANYKSNQDVVEPAAEQKGIRLGCSSPQKQYYINGAAIDELKIFNQALSADEIRAIMNTRPGENAPPQTVLYIPFEGKVDPNCAMGTVAASADRLIFQPAVIGQGASFIRYGYDARSSMSVQDIPGITAAGMTADFFFIPNWNGGDNAVHGLLHARAGDFSWLLRVQNNELEFVTFTGSKSNRIAVAVNNWKKNVPVHIAAGYDVVAKKMFLALNGKIVASGAFTLTPTDQNASLTVGDYADCDMYRKSQAEGVIDELRLFSVCLSPAQLQQEIARRDHVKVQVSDRNTAPLASRPVSDRERKLWDLNGAYRSSTASRTKICLNALWRFQLTAEGKTPQVSKWHYLAVPGCYSGQENGNSDHQFLMRNPDFSLGDKRQLWEGEPTYKFFNSWFERSFKADPAWRNHRLVLRFDELSNTEAGQLYLNGKFLAELTGAKSYEIEIKPDQLKFDTDNALLLHLFDSGNRWSWRGIKGDVWLEIQPDTVISRPYLVTSVTDKHFNLNVQIDNYSRQTRQLKLEAAILGDRAPATLSSKTISLPPGGKITTGLAAAWPEPRLWNYEQPYLYRCQLRLLDEQGKQIDVYPEFKFGFREFKIIGSDYYLNGQKIHLRNHDTWMNASSDYEQCRQYVKLLKELGYNSVRGNFDDKDFKMDNIIRASDEEGMLLFLNIFGVSQKEYSSWSNPQTRIELEKRMASRIVEWRNHPSIVMWYLSVNFLGYGWDYHPLKMADGYQPAYKQTPYKTCLEAVKFMERYDSSRPYFFQAGGNFGPVINSNAYFCWWPQAEKNAWVNEWSKKATKPLHIIETSFPYDKTFFGMDLRFSAGKPLFVVENAARYFGENAYINVEKALRDLTINSRTKSAESLKWAFLSINRDLELIGKVKSHMLVETVRNWRADGISGICPFEELRYAYRRKSPHQSIHDAYAVKQKIADFRQPGWHQDIAKLPAFTDIDTAQPLPYLAAIRKAMAPILVFIGNSAPNPSSLACNYYAGKPIDKVLVLINDTLAPQKFAVTWQLLDRNNKACADGSVNSELAPGEIVRVPLALKAPSVAAKTGYRLTAKADAPAMVSIDPVELTVFPSRPELNQQVKIALYDPRGLSAGSLRELGVKFDNAVTASDLNAYSLLIIGREAFDSSFAAWAQKIKLPTWLENGHGNVIMLEQIPAALHMLGLETNAIYTREVFKPIASIPQLRHLDNADLANWHGDGTLAPSRQPPPAITEENVSSPLWHWSNLNMVCSYPIRRPSAGMYRNLLVCGKDLVYAPLLEITCGRGQLVFCQLEVSGRTNVEPAAAVVLADLINYYSTVKPIAVKKSLTLLDPSDKTLAALGFPCVGLTESKLPSDAVVIANRPLHDAEMGRLLDAVKAGATVLFTVSDPNAFARLQVKTSPTSLWTFSVTEAGRSALSTLSPRDRFFRYPITAQLVSGPTVKELTSPALITELPSGKGRFLFLLIDTAAQGKFYDQAVKIDWNSSNLWAESLLRERYCELLTTLLSRQAVQAESLAARLADPILPPARFDLSGSWDFRTDPADTGLKQHWQQSGQFVATTGWSKLKVPGFWESQGINQLNPNLPANPKSKGYDGFAWYRKTVIIPPELRGKPLLFHADFIDDFDQVYVNGTEIGRTGEETEGYWQAPRNYPIPAKLLADGKLNIAVRVFDARGQGGMGGMVWLQENIKPVNAGPFPYYTRPIPGYDTEAAIRW